MEPEDRKRVDRAKADAASLGYMLVVMKAPNMPGKYMAVAAKHSLETTTMGRWLAYGGSPGEAAEVGVEELRRLIGEGDV